jgi:predicted nucleotidyltransferase
MNDTAEMPLDMVITRLRGIAPAIRAFGVTRLAIFGSRARGTARPDSDLDVLIETASGKTQRFDVFRVQHLIEDTTGLPTQVALRRLLRPRVAERISDDVIEVF